MMIFLLTLSHLFFAGASVDKSKFDSAKRAEFFWRVTNSIKTYGQFYSLVENIEQSGQLNELLKISKKRGIYTNSPFLRAKQLGPNKIEFIYDGLKKKSTFEAVDEKKFKIDGKTVRLVGDSIVGRLIKKLKVKSKSSHGIQSVFVSEAYATTLSGGELDILLGEVAGAIYNIGQVLKTHRDMLIPDREMRM